jgi:pimeloyl-[acyl-carrier protein] methyl ester esterase
VILRLLHGWAFDATLWHHVIPLLPEFDCRADDRGYFGPAMAVSEGEVAVCHSFGTLRALAAPHGFRALVAINGFDCFAARPGFPGIPARLVARMLARCDADPAPVVQDFRARCGQAETPPLRDSRALRADLAALAEQDQRGACTLPVVSLQATDDPIVPFAMHPALFAAAPLAERTTLPVGGHLLPLTAPEACAAAIRRAVELAA